MNERIKNPHTFDMSNYLQGLTYEVGGFDPDKKDDDKKLPKKEVSASQNFTLDWSFLYKNPNSRKRF